MIKYAQVGGHKTYLQSLDVRTLGVAGGSMIRVQDGRVVDVGPRSAHIAGKGYECFAQEGAITSGTVRLIRPRADDPCEYAILAGQNGAEYAYTLVGAANLLGYVPQDDYARGVDASNAAAWEILGRYLKLFRQGCRPSGRRSGNGKAVCCGGGTDRGIRAGPEIYHACWRRRQRRGHRQRPGGEDGC